MIKTLEVSIERIPSDTAITPESVMLVVRMRTGDSAVDLYRRLAGASHACKAGEEVAAIVSSEALNTPDHVSAIGSQRDAMTFKIDLEIRRFRGPIRANDPWIALINMHLGALKSGVYELVVHETEFRFAEMRHPERATRWADRERRMAFDCY